MLADVHEHVLVILLILQVNGDHLIQFTVLAA